MKYRILGAFLVMTTIAFGQRKGKITGNKEVVENGGDLPDFRAIDISDELVVSINQGAISGYTLVTDENLVDSIEFTVRDSVLSIYTTNKITRSKKLEILVNTTALDKIMLSNKAKLSAVSTIRSNALEVTLIEGAELEMDIKADSLTMHIKDNSKAEFEYKGDRIEINMEDNAFAEADINTATFHLNASSRSDIELKGVGLASIITSSGNAEVKAKDFDTDVISIFGSESTDISILVEKEADIDLRDKAQLYLYGKPEIKINNLADSAEILKRD